MGRKAGVTPEQTRAVLFEAAARVFALKGYDGATIADICQEAGLSSGSVYAHYRSKAELFTAVLQDHGNRQFEALVGTQNISNIVDFVRVAGSTYDRRNPTDATLMIEAIVAAKRDPEVAALASAWLRTTESLLATSISEAQSDGVLDDSIRPESISRLATMLALGSFLTAALDVEPLDHDDWTRLVNRLVDSIRIQPGESS